MWRMYTRLQASFAPCKIFRGKSSVYHGSVDTSKDVFGFHPIRYQRVLLGLHVKGMAGREQERILTLESVNMRKEGRKDADQLDDVKHSIEYTRPDPPFLTLLSRAIKGVERYRDIPCELKGLPALGGRQIP